LVPGFVTPDRREDLDLNVETTRLLRSQFRSKTSLHVIESADILPLAEMATQSPLTADGPNGTGESQTPRPGPIHVIDRADWQAREMIFANSTFWKRLGEEYLNPLILAGTVRFVPEALAGFTQRDREEFDPVARRRITTDRMDAQTTGYRLAATFVLTDGRTGVVLHADTFHEEVFYGRNQHIAALSCYFQLMDRIVPAVLTTVSDQTIRAPRVLLK
jgi:hypothetical protein